MRITLCLSLKSFSRDETGAVAIEYVLIAAAMGFALVASAPFLATAVQGKLNGVTGLFSMF